MAEGVFRSLTKSHPLIANVDSAGTGAYHTLSPPDYRTMSVLRRNGIKDYDHGARLLIPEDFDDFDYIFAMDAWNLRDIVRMQKRVESKSGGSKRATVMLFGAYSGITKGSAKARGEEVIDPYYGADDGFETVYEQVSRFSNNFLHEIEQQAAKEPQEEQSKVPATS
jgi:low molecular weight phosphotyrosine protein phosphatase